MLTLRNDSMVFSFPSVHPEAILTITLMRTFRVPDDGNRYALPPGFGTFPVKHVDDFQGRVPAKWVKHGGVMVPMYQSEAMWLHFQSSFVSNPHVQYPFAIRVATGKRSAVTGRGWTKKMKEKDYVVSPQQKWLDGYVVSDGTVRQFVASPLGHGLTAEEQITGKAEFGGLQIEVVPMSREAFDRRHPPRPVQLNVDSFRGSVTRGVQTKSAGLVFPDSATHVTLNCSSSCNPVFGTPGVYTEVLTNGGVATMDSMVQISEVSEMGIAPGGSIIQQVFDDPYGLSDWSTAEKSRCFVHMLNSMAWRQATDAAPPTVPITAAEYARRGLPWYDYYADAPTVKGTAVTAALKSVAQVNPGFLPENKSVSVGTVVKTVGSVRDGTWT